MEEDKKLRERSSRSEWQREKVEKESLEWSPPGLQLQERAIPL